MNLELKDLYFPLLPNCGEDWCTFNYRDVEDIAKGEAHKRCQKDYPVIARATHAKKLKVVGGFFLEEATSV